MADEKNKPAAHAAHAEPAAEKTISEVEDDAREKLLGDPVELLFNEKAVLPSGEIVEAGEVAEVPADMARATVATGRARYNTVDPLTGKKKASSGKGRKKK